MNKRHCVNWHSPDSKRGKHKTQKKTMTNTHDWRRSKSWWQQQWDFLLVAHRYSKIIIFHRHRGVLSMTVDELQCRRFGFTQTVGDSVWTLRGDHLGGSKHRQPVRMYGERTAHVLSEGEEGCWVWYRKAVHPAPSALASLKHIRSWLEAKQVPFVLNLEPLSHVKILAQRHAHTLALQQSRFLILQLMLFLPRGSQNLLSAKFEEGLPILTIISHIIRS